tara:strand:- start:4374 stop:5015 length:642 start_codon:yes stop_codon:yes gene_type:complete
MNKLIINTLFLFFPIFFIAQEERITLNRIRLIEKQNQIIRGLPKILLEAYCKGEITAYYPKYIKAQVSYSEFLNYSGLKDPTYNEQGLLCPNEFCNLSQDNLKMFNRALEFLEIEKRAHVGQEPFKDIKYVILKIYDDKNNSYNGPVFFVKDILKLSEKYRLYNPKNDASPLSIKKVFLSRMFSSTVIKDYTNSKFSPNSSKDKNTSDDLYEY